MVWWVLLCGIAALNILAWMLSAALLRRRQAVMSPEIYLASRTQLLLSAGYVFGCAFRSVLPVFDVPRLVLHDTWLSDVIVGRSVATVAELCFVAQWALLLRHTAWVSGSLTARLVSRAVLPLIAVAEICSWYAVLTTANLGHVVEETLWGVSAGLVVVSLFGVWPRCPPAWRPALAAACATAAAYVGYMFLVDVPRYWSRWVLDQAHGRHYLSLAAGLADVAQRRVVSWRWRDWHGEMLWMSLYFSVAVWISIWLVHACGRALAHRTHPRRLETRPPRG
ncbi:MAG TPA: hypothetical protein VMH77_08875 [Steroidobacteraceae bacterium]|nr:hypothetical protein [Steroidobacteraceae bacterium]